ncbi:MAG: Ycf51 family protein [Cyanobacteria bacterium J06621_8]
MDFTPDLFLYAKWTGIATLACLLFTIVSFVVGWGVRFRFVGITSFMGVVSAGLLALGLGFYPHVDIPGSVRYALVYDTGSNSAVVAVPPTIEESAIEPTLIQAATDLYSYGRTGTGGNNQFRVRLRTVLHPESGVSQPLFLGEARRMLINRQNADIETKIYSQNVLLLPKSAESS